MDAVAVPPLPLAGVRIAVTRPRHQADKLAGLIEAAGGEAIVFPVLEIVDADDPAPARTLLGRAAQFDRVFFVSPNAVEKALALAPCPIPRALPVAAVGRATAAALTVAGFCDVLFPRDGADSEALLALPELQAVAGKRFLVARGQGGRELLGDTLRARGATVECAECYQRGIPDADPEILLAPWRRGELHGVTVTSSEGLANLLTLIGAEGRRRLEATPLFVPHPRIAAAARQAGLGRVVTTGANDEGLAQGVVAWFAGKRP